MREDGKTGLVALLNVDIHNGDTEWRACGVVDGDHVIMQAHFPSSPVVPAFLQLSWIVELLSSGATSTFTVPDAKFLHPIRAGSNVEVRINRSETGSFAFSIRSDDAIATKGTLVVDGASSKWRGF